MLTDADNTKATRDALATIALGAFADMMTTMAGPIAARAAMEKLERGDFSLEITTMLPSCDVAIVAVTRDGQRLDVANLISAASTARN